MKKLQVIPCIFLVSILVSACGGGTEDTGSESVAHTEPAVGAVQEVNAEPDVGVEPTETQQAVQEINAEPDIGVDPAATQQKVDLSWNPPSTRTDGSVMNLSDLEGYRIYSGSSPDELILLVDLVDGATNYSISNLPQGTYYFAVTAYDVDGLESGFSEIVTKEII